MGLRLAPSCTLGKENDLAFQIPPREPWNFLHFCHPHASTARSAVMAATGLLQGGIAIGSRELKVRQDRVQFSHSHLT